MTAAVLIARGWEGLVWRTATQTPPPMPDESLVTPTWIGFAVTLALAIVVVLIIMDMIRRIRRMNYRAEIRQKLDNEEAARIEAVEHAGDGTQDTSATNSTETDASNGRRRSE